MHRPKAPVTFIKVELQKLQEIRKSLSVHLETICWERHPLLWPSKELVNDEKHDECVRRLEYRIREMETLHLQPAQQKLAISDGSESSQNSVFQLTELFFTEDLLEQ
ncbi:hypothetical protein FGIG_10425 [Fasciola gigantica]|uniref:Uncharacterized protein n=1 Tax=Fasciola gigantica TaxID=46835 RepID=A0A504YSC7_FASGI|nr:hypothetical protein FGIG_10425 [Fasciola gigantica]